MDTKTEDKSWSSLTHEEKNRELFLRQGHLLDLFLERGAISQEQYDKSLGELTARLGMDKQE